MSEAPVVARATSTAGNALHAVAADQAGSAGGGAALLATSRNPDVPAVVVRGAGTLLDLRDTGGTTVASVSQTGAVTAAGGVSGSVSPSGDLSVSNGNLIAATAGKGLQVKEGSNATMGTLTLNGATPVVVSTTAVTATSRIFLTHNAPGGTPAFAWVSARSAGASFSVTGTALDTSTVAWLIVNPAA